MLCVPCVVCSGADIRSVCTEAGMFAIRERRKVSGPECGGGMAMKGV